MHQNSERGWLQIFKRRINIYLSISISLILIAILLIAFKVPSYISLFLLICAFLITLSYILNETNEVEDIEEHIKLAIEEKKFKKFGNEERLDQFNTLRKLVESISTEYINNANELLYLKVFIDGLSQTIDDGFFIVSSKGEIVFKNRAAENFIKLKDKKIFYEAIRNSKMIDFISKALEQKTVPLENIEIEIDDIKYLTTVKPITVNDNDFYLLFYFKKVNNMQSEALIEREFLEAVSHEMKTPLSSIIGTVEIIESENFIKKKGEKFLEILKENSKRLADLTERILKISEINTLKSNLNEVLNLKKIGENSIQKYKELFEEKGVALKVDVEDDVFIKGNQFLIEDVIINLIENAYKYTDKGEVRFSIKKDGGAAIIEVEDTGKGIKEENLEKIFEPFYREDKSRNEQVRGTGLGLTITNKIVELHKGKIEVRSSVGKGTLFRVKIPLAS
ncbi:MAG: HAMP domain-containing histidine kinase [Candidatus Atribacteria bacterium]|nr:HAMP domain-containing histidine kinase [Candidatus Atribacteria bacterium]